MLLPRLRGGEQTASGWTPSEIMADRAAIRRGDIERSRGGKIPGERTVATAVH